MRDFDDEHVYEDNVQEEPDWWGDPAICQHCGGKGGTIIPSNTFDTADFADRCDWCEGTGEPLDREITTRLNVDNAGWLWVRFRMDAPDMIPYGFQIADGESLTQPEVFTPTDDPWVAECVARALIAVGMLGMPFDTLMDMVRALLTTEPEGPT